MSHRKSKTSGRTSYDRPIAYDREILIEICRRLIIGQNLQAICSKPPMPIGTVFLGWVQDHKEAREIYRSAQNFQSDRKLAKEVAGSFLVSTSEWEEQVRANLQRGWPADWFERKYIPPDWNKVYPVLGGPPVRSTENMRAYNDLINDFTQMLEPRDEMELIWTKEATDAAWEANCLAREKNRSRAGSKYCQALDIAQMRAIRRRDNALRQIARWRKGLGAKPRRLPDCLVVERLLARRYGVEPLAEADTDVIPIGIAEAAAPLALAPETPKPTRSFAPPAEAAEAEPPLAMAVEAAEAAPPVAATGDGATAAAPAVNRTGKAAEASPALAPAPKGAEAMPSLAAAADAAQASPPIRAPTEPADQHHRSSRSQPGSAQGKLDGHRAVRFLAEPNQSPAANANQRL
jgi:hypothetical protein